MQKKNQNCDFFAVVVSFQCLDTAQRLLGMTVHRRPTVISEHDVERTLRGQGDDRQGDPLKLLNSKYFFYCSKQLSAASLKLSLSSNARKWFDYLYVWISSLPPALSGGGGGGGGGV